MEEQVKTYGATYDVQYQEGSDTEDGRAHFTGFAHWPEHVDHDPYGDKLLDENDQPVLLEFEVSVYMPTDETARATAMQAYVDDYEKGYWEAVAQGHLNSPENS